MHEGAVLEALRACPAPTIYSHDATGDARTRDVLRMPARGRYAHPQWGAMRTRNGHARTRNGALCTPARGMRAPAGARVRP